MHSFYLFLWIFFIYSFLGWCLEVCFFALNTGKFVNRGFLNGPVCPIYGFGVVIVVLCLTPLMENTLLLFLGSVLLTSAAGTGGWLRAGEAFPSALVGLHQRAFQPGRLYLPALLPGLGAGLPAGDGDHPPLGAMAYPPHPPHPGPGPAGLLRLRHGGGPDRHRAHHRPDQPQPGPNRRAGRPYQGSLQRFGRKFG